MRIESIVIPPIMENCYILHDGEHAIVFDPGGDFESIKEFIDGKSLKVAAILLTHGHFDHIGAAENLKQDTSAPIYAHAGDMELIENGNHHAARFGVSPFDIPKIDKFVENGEKITFDFVEIKVIHTPGHSEGSVCYYIEKDKLLISGDTLFAESVGRTDLPGGDFDTIEKSIKEHLYTLHENTIVYPGHGYRTTIVHEKKFNPIVKS